MGPTRYRVARDAAEEAGDVDGMRAAERGAELWRAPDPIAKPSRVPAELQNTRLDGRRR